MGGGDFDSFTPGQVFEYTRLTEGDEIAITDVKESFAEIEKQINKAESVLCLHFYHTKTIKRDAPQMCYIKV